MFKMSNVIGVLSAKGGVGKTTSAINIASALNQFGYSTLVLDTDITSPNIGIYLGKSNHPYSLNHVLYSNIDINKAIINHSSGIDVITGSLKPNIHQNVDYNQIDINIKRLINNYQFIIIDSAPGRYEDSIKYFSTMKDIIVVTTPDLVAVTDALRTVTAAKLNGKNVIGAILTRVGNNDYEIRKENVEAMLGVKVLASIPEDKNIPLSLKVNNPIIETHPNSDSTIAYKKIAANLLGQNYRVFDKV